MNRSPLRVVELCVYALIIIAAVIWIAAGGSIYNPPEMPTAAPQTTVPTISAPPLISVPKGEFLPGR